MHPTWPYPGSRWWKFDFHTHTPASTDTPWHSRLGTPEELTPGAWLLKYMAAEIDCVAITDHNSGEWVDKLKAAYTAMQRQAKTGQAPVGFRELHLFPGVEISVQGGFHLLAIFDPSATSQTISDLLAKVEYTGTRGDSDGVTRKGAAEVVAQVKAEGGLAIAAHADRDKGLLQLETSTGKSRLDVNTVRSVLQEPGLVALEWMMPDWSFLPPALLAEMQRTFVRVLGSDCHSFRGQAIPGSRYTWIKMASPNLEGLRLALLDGQGVSVRRSDDGNGFTPFQKPEHFIEALEVQNASYMGRGSKAQRFTFSPYFNALIGGRGTGKSTVIHALRLAYRREQELLPGSEAEQTFGRFIQVAKTRNAPGGLRLDTVVCVEVSRDGLGHHVHWRQDGQGVVVEDWDAATQTFKPSASQEVSAERFPIRLFSQGQIAALADDGAQALLNVVDDAAGTRTAQAALDEAKRAFLSTRAQIRELNGKLKEREVLTVKLGDVQRKLARFEGADHAVILKNYQRAHRQDKELAHQFESAAELTQRLNSLAEAFCLEDLPDGLFDTQADVSALQTVQALQAAVAQARDEVVRAVAQLQAQGQLLRAQLAAAPWSAGHAQARQAYGQLKTDLQQQGVSDPSEYGRLVQERQQLSIEAKRLDALGQQRDGLETRASVQLAAVLAARAAISDKREIFLSDVLRNNAFVRMTLVRYSRDASVTERSLRELLSVMDGRFADDLYQESQDAVPAKGLVANLLGDAATFGQTLQLQKERLVRACNGDGDFGARFNKFLKTEADKRPELIDHLLCWFPEDSLSVAYSRKGNGQDFQPIGQASAGQRAAALLAFLLAHGTEPLVLDQPEDDLDNHLIYDLVVQQIRANKMRRQLIIVTHNPNIVVNGDAEWIQVMDFNHQCFVKQKGGLQEQAVRAEVCQVMEGGKKAFEDRYQRLGREG
jgi:energy-coupling factor transporter ATP-binding protein EcfA2